MREPELKQEFNPILATVTRKDIFKGPLNSSIRIELLPHPESGFPRHGDRGVLIPVQNQILRSMEISQHG